MGAGQRLFGDASGLAGWRRMPRRDGQWVVDRPAVIAGLVDAMLRAIEYRRLFVLLPFSMIFGLISYAALPSEPHPYLLVMGTAACVAVLGLALARRALPVFRSATQLLALWLGFCLLPLHGLVLGTPMLLYPAYGIYEAQVDEILSSNPGVTRVIASKLVPVEDAKPVPIRRARIVVAADLRLMPGDRLRAPLRLAPVPGPILPGAHDSQFHSYFAGVGAFGATTGRVEIIAADETLSLDRLVQGLRDHIGDRIDATLNGQTAAIGKAMVVGDQADIANGTREIMAASGLAHIYSISGLHLSIVAGGIFWLLRLALASVPALVAWPVKQIAALVGIVAAFLYLLLAGGLDNVPAFRSTLMLVLIFGAVLAGRQALTMRNVAIAAIVIILIDPASVFRPSFQLSFAAVVGLIGIYEMPRPHPPARSGRLARIGGVILATAWTSLIAGLATLLFSAYHFQQTAPLGVLGNVLALPFVSLVIMPFGVLSVLAMPLGLEAPCLQAMGWGIDRMVDIAELVAGWSLGWTGNPLLAQWTLIAGLVALAWFAFLDGRWRLLGPVLALPVVLSLGLEQRPDILIADSTQAIAMRDGDGMALVAGRLGSFAVDVWSDHFQTAIAAQHPLARCDSLGCVVAEERFSVAIVRNASAFAEDCGRHDLLIARIYPPQYCFAAGAVIGPRQLADGGVHWLTWDEGAGQFDIRPAISSLARPWRLARRP